MVDAEKLVKVRALVSLAGERISVSVGDEVDFPSAEAERLVAAGYAEPIGWKPSGPPAAELEEQASPHPERKRNRRPVEEATRESEERAVTREGRSET